MKGYDDGCARPNNSISRVEGMVIASRLLKLEKLCGEGGRFLQLAPHTSGTDGFFAAVWQRV